MPAGRPKTWLAAPGVGELLKAVGRIARRQAAGRGDGAAVCAVYEGEV